MAYKFHTWHAESAVVAALLLTTALVSGGSWVEWCGSAAVWCGFSHASIAERLREREAAKSAPSVECHNKLGWYFMGREVLWTIYFLALGAWSALVGCVLFAAYPIWRQWWRKFHPLPKTYQVLDPELWDRINSGEPLMVSVGTVTHPFNLSASDSGYVAREPVLVDGPQPEPLRSEALAEQYAKIADSIVPKTRWWPGSSPTITAPTAV